MAPADILRRAGAELTLAKLPTNPADSGNLLVRCSRGIVLHADTLFPLSHDKEWDMILIPGGPGAKTLGRSVELIRLLQRQRQEGRWIGAICAAPTVVLAKNGLLEGETATAFPGEQGKLPDRSRAKDLVVVSNKIVTSQGPGTAVLYGLVLVEVLFGKSKAREIRRQIVAADVNPQRFNDI